MLLHRLHVDSKFQGEGKKSQEVETKTHSSRKVSVSGINMHFTSRLTARFKWITLKMHFHDTLFKNLISPPSLSVSLNRCHSRPFKMWWLTPGWVPAPSICVQFASAICRLVGWGWGVMNCICWWLFWGQKCLQPHAEVVCVWDFLFFFYLSFLVHLHLGFMWFCSTWFQSVVCPSITPHPPTPHPLLNLSKPQPPLFIFSLHPLLHLISLFPSIQIFFIGMTGLVVGDSHRHGGTMHCDGDIHMIMPSVLTRLQIHLDSQSPFLPPLFSLSALGLFGCIFLCVDFSNGF